MADNYDPQAVEALNDKIRERGSKYIDFKTMDIKAPTSGGVLDNKDYYESLPAVYKVLQEVESNRAKRKKATDDYVKGIQLYYQGKNRESGQPATPPGVLETPGSYEQQYEKTRGFFDQPTNSQQLMDLAKYLGYFSTPTKSQETFESQKQFFEDPTRSGTAYQNMQNSDWYKDPTKANDIFGVLQNQGFFNDPTKSGEFWGQTGSKLSGMTGGKNDSAAYFRQHMMNRPDVSREPGLDKYYDTAVSRALEDQQRASAARGQYGTTTAQDMEGRRIAELRAEQSNREADYNLARLAEQRAWEGLGGELANYSQTGKRMWTDTLGNLAQGTDAANTARALGQSNIAQGTDQTDLAKQLGISNIATSADAADLAKALGFSTVASTTDNAINDRVRSWSDLAGGADDTSLEKIISGLGAAQTNQNIFQDRVRMPLGDTGGVTGSINSTLGQIFPDLFKSDQDIFESGTSYAGGTTKEGQGQRTDQINQFTEMLSTIMEMVSKMYGGM